MNIEVELPDLGNDAGDHATIVEWHFDEGETVEQGEILLEVSCESGVVIEVPAPRAGTLIERIVEEDEIVRVGEPVAVMECSDDEVIAEDDEE